MAVQILIGQHIFARRGCNTRLPAGCRRAQRHGPERFGNFPHQSKWARSYGEIDLGAIFFLSVLRALSAASSSFPGGRDVNCLSHSIRGGGGYSSSSKWWWWWRTWPLVFVCNLFFAVFKGAGRPSPAVTVDGPALLPPLLLPASDDERRRTSGKMRKITLCFVMMRTGLPIWKPSTETKKTPPPFSAAERAPYMPVHKVFFFPFLYSTSFYPEWSSVLLWPSRAWKI